MSTDVIASGRPGSPRTPGRALHVPGLRPLAAVVVILMIPLAGADRVEPVPPESATATQAAGSPTVAALGQAVTELGARFEAWYNRTPPMERVAWGGLLACALLGVSVTLERCVRVRRTRIIPEAFVERFQKRLSEGGLERGKALDYCELNPSPAARVALAAIRRWGRSTVDLERGVSLSRQVEVDQLRHHLGTLRRVAAMSPLVGLLGTLSSAERILSAIEPGTQWGPVLAGALGSLTAGVALAIVALLAFDGLTVRVERLAADLERIGAETIDAIALAAPAYLATMPVPPPTIPAMSVPTTRPAPSRPVPPTSGVAPTHRVQQGHGPGLPSSPSGRPIPYSLRSSSRKADRR